MLQDYWYIACSASAIRRSPVSITAFGRSLVVFRSSNAKPGILIDRCAHRNAPLSAGAVVDGLLQCPYHGWSYDTNGVLRDIPACPRTNQQDVASLDISVSAYHCVEQDGYIWFCLSASPHTEAPPRFAFLGDSGWTSFKMDTLFEGPVDSCLENFLDCPHATFVHRHWFRAPTQKSVKAIVRTTDDGAEAEYFEEPREGSVVWSLLSKDESSMRHTDRFIAPATSRVDYIFSDKRHYVITSCCTPVNERQTRVHTVITFRFGSIGWLVRCFFEPLSRWIIRQDVKMVKLQQDNVERFSEKHYRVITQDLLYKHIVRWRSCIEKNLPPPAAGITERVDIVL